MKKLIMLHILLCMVGVNQAMDESNEQSIRLPSAQVLKQHLQKAGFSDFLERIMRNDEFGQIDNLGGQQRSPWEVFSFVEGALYQAYEKDPSDYEKAMKMQKKKLEITHIILQDFPEAIKRLGREGIVLKVCGGRYIVL